jgi:aspartyl aminopeptidase
VKEAVLLAEAAGFVPYSPGKVIKSGDKLYYVNRGKSLMLAVIGSLSLSEGANIAAAHIDSPRLDLKQNPLYEDSELAYFKTHYYGGIKKYQWVTIPLELHGVLALKSGENIEIVIGRDPGDPVFVITDLLPHLSADQYKKNLAESFPGESLNILLGSRPYAEKCESDSVKLNIMEILNKKYGISEEDFLSAEISAVPSVTTRDIGLDRSLLGGYGHDDRVCAYASLRAILDTKAPKKTAVCVLADKEEIGSEGVSGLKSAAFDTFMKGLCDSQGVDLGLCFSKSCCISADVCNAFDPNYAEVSDKRNNARINYGVGICKYTGSRGKSSASDASAELVAKMRRLFDENNVVWQMAELGKVDQGGGGTVAVYMAQRNIDTIDAGVPVLSMHAPFEVVSKLDAYMTYRAVASLYAE